MKSLFALLFALITVAIQAQPLPFAKLHNYDVGSFDSSATEVIAYDRISKRLYSTNKSKNAIDIISYSDFDKPGKIGSIDLNPYLGEVTGVDVYFGLVAVIGTASIPQLPGKLMFFDKDGLIQAQFAIGAQPEMITYTPGGNLVVIANEGAPTDDYLGDPWGSVSILDVSPGFNFVTQSDMKTVYFDRLDTVAPDPGVRIFGNLGMQTAAQDIEPEFITINSAQTKAYVSLQENNAIAIVDLYGGSLDTVIALGYKDYTTIGLDASDRANAINIGPHTNLYGMYQPDGLVTLTDNGTDYILSANQGAARDYSGYSEMKRVAGMVLNFPKFPTWPTIQHDTVLGRLHVTTALGDGNNDGIYDSLYCFGTRSFSVWDDNLQLLWDSGDDFEQTLKLLNASAFNSDDIDNNSRKSRSDDMGPEPTGIDIGEVDGKTYAFISLTKMGGIMIYDVTNPTSPQFVQYELNRDFSKTATDPAAGDLGPSGITFVKAADNRRGLPLLFVANKVSGSISVYEMGQGVGLNEGYDLPKNDFYPNPSSGVFNSAQYGDYEVYDANGRLVQTVINRDQVDLSKEASGFYLIKSKDGASIRVIKK